MKFKKIASFSDLLPRAKRKPVETGMAPDEPQHIIPQQEQPQGKPRMETGFSKASESAMLERIAHLQTEHAEIQGILDHRMLHFCQRLHSRISALETKPSINRDGVCFRLDQVKTLIRADHKSIEVSCYALKECLNITEKQEQEVRNYREILAKAGTYSTFGEDGMVLRQNFSLPFTPGSPEILQLLQLTTPKGERWLSQQQLSWPTAEAEHREIGQQVIRILEIEARLSWLMREYITMCLRAVALDLLHQGGILAQYHKYVLLGSTAPQVDFTRGRGELAATVHLIREDWRDLDLPAQRRSYIEHMKSCSNVSPKFHAPDMVKQGILVEVPYETCWLPTLDEFRQEFRNSVWRILPYPNKIVL